MTVVTPGGPCLTQTQINRNEAQERFQKQQEDKNAVTSNPAASGVQQAANKVTGVEKTDNNSQGQLSYGAPGEHLVDISV